MSDVRQAVATLAGYVASDSMQVPDAVVAAAAVYAAACQAVNNRLAACDQLLRINQRSEALRQAQLEPDVLTLYAGLDFRDRGRWQQIAERIGAAAPPPLDAPLARRLNQAFADENRVRDLLAQHRLAALTRAPLRRRLDVLRLLARAEPTNLGWKDDLRGYELARYDEIRAALAHPSPAAEWRAVSELLGELKAPVWTASSPPLDLIAAAEEIVTRHRRRHGMVLLAQIGADLRAATGARDLDRAKKLTEEAWAVAVEHDIRGQALDPIKQAQEWVDDAAAEEKDRKKFEAALSELRQAMDDGLDWVYVQDAYRFAIGLGRPLPPGVAGRFAALAARRFWIRAAAAGGALLALTVAGAAFVIYTLAR